MTTLTTQWHSLVSNTSVYEQELFKWEVIEKIEVTTAIAATVSLLAIPIFSSTSYFELFLSLYNNPYILVASLLLPTLVPMLHTFILDQQKTHQALLTKANFLKNQSKQLPQTTTTCLDYHLAYHQDLLTKSEAAREKALQPVNNPNAFALNNIKEYLKDSLNVQRGLLWNVATPEEAKEPIRNCLTYLDKNLDQPIATLLKDEKLPPHLKPYLEQAEVSPPLFRYTILHNKDQEIFIHKIHYLFLSAMKKHTETQNDSLFQSTFTKHKLNLEQGIHDYATITLFSLEQIGAFSKYGDLDSQPLVSFKTDAFTYKEIKDLDIQNTDTVNSLAKKILTAII